MAERNLKQVPWQIGTGTHVNADGQAYPLMAAVLAVLQDVRELLVQVRDEARNQEWRKGGRR